MRRQPLILVAASGLAREVIAAVGDSEDHQIVGMLDDDPTRVGSAVSDVPVLGRIDAAGAQHGVKFLVCTGSGRTRAQIVRRLGAAGVGPGRYATMIHPSVEVPRCSTVGEGSILLAQVVVTAGVTIGRHVVAMPHVVLTHDDIIDDFATLCAGVVLGGGVRVRAAAYLGMNSSVREFVQVGEAATLGMGSALLHDLPAGQTWAGVPARPLRLSAVGVG